jgi:cyclophilin family peptidyl-prolyl cis-trans isomerase
VSKARVRPAPAPEPDDDYALPGAWRRRPWIPYLIIAVVIAAVLGGGLAMDQALKPAVPSALANCKTSEQVGPRQFIGLQPICILPGRSYTATMNTTAGQIVIHLLPESAPLTVNNFVVLAVNGYYNGLTFWDSQDWEVQAGDPLGNGRGGPGYSLPDEATAGLTWDPGAVGMARQVGRSVNGSQFFIVKSSWPGNGPTAVYNRFGTVTAGLDKVSAISAGDRINTVTISVSAPASASR